MIQYIRRTLQISVILFAIVVPLLSLYGILVENYRLHTVSGPAWQEFMDMTDDYVRKLTDDPVAFAKSVKGTLFWSVNFGDFNLTDPLAAVGVMLGSFSFYQPLLISIIPLILITALLGRVYCGWICPMDLVFEINNFFRRMLNKIGLRQANIRFSRGNKYALLFMGVVFTAVLGVQVLSFLYPPLLINREIIHLIYFGSLGIGATVIFTLLFVEITLSPRMWCRYFCPGGALWSLIGKFRVLRILRNEKLCDNCGKCNDACEFALRPMTDDLGMECNNCGACIAECGTKSLEYKTVIPWRDLKENK